MNRCTLIKLNRGLGIFGVEWDALHARLFRPNPLLDSRFIDEALRHFGDGTESLAVFRLGGMLREVIRHAFKAHPDGVIEFYTDAKVDMLSWATEQRWIRHISYYHSAISIRIIQTARACRKLMIEREFLLISIKSRVLLK